MPQVLRIGFLFALLSALLLQVAPAWARPPTSAASSSAAELSLAGPRTALGVGAALTIAAPVVGAASAVRLAFSGPSWLGCEDWFSGAVDEQCAEEERAHEQHVDEAMPRIIAGSVSLGVIGLGLTTLGIVRVIQVKRARARRPRFQGAGLELTPQTTHIALRFRF